MSAESNFMEAFRNWGNRTNTNGVTSQLSHWSDYVKSTAENMYTSLPSYNTDVNQNSQQEWFKLSRIERMIAFVCCIASSFLCFVLCFFMFPVLALNPRKFGLLWTMGSFLFIVSFGIMQGFTSYIRHLLSRERLVFTVVYFGSVFTTLYVALVKRSTILTIICSLFEVFAVIYYSVSYFPFGAQTVLWFTSYISGYIGGFIGGIL